MGRESKREGTVTKVLTEEQKAEYVACGGSKCPYCGSKEVEADKVECDGDEGWGPARCQTCKQEWTDQWSLTGIAQVE